MDATIGGLPAAPSAAVYAESRSVPIAGGALADTFGRWSVHVYRLTASTGQFQLIVGQVRAGKAKVAPRSRVITPSALACG